jgi:hypothetical protein
MDPDAFFNKYCVEVERFKRGSKLQPEEFKEMLKEYGREPGDVSSLFVSWFSF